VRVNGRRIERAHAPVRVGDLITFPHGNVVRVVRVEKLPARRGPASEAQLCYSGIAPPPPAIAPAQQGPAQS